MGVFMGPVGAGYCRTSRDILLTKEGAVPTLFCTGAASLHILEGSFGHNNIRKI